VSLFALRLAQQNVVQHDRLQDARNHLPRVREWPLMPRGDRSSFRFRLVGNSLTIYEGTLRIHGIGNYTLAEQTITLSGSTEWVFVYRARTGGAIYLDHQAVEPESNSTYLYVPLYKFTSSDGGATYTLDRDCRYDINLDTPLR